MTDDRGAVATGGRVVREPLTGQVGDIESLPRAFLERALRRRAVVDSDDEN